MGGEVGRGWRLGRGLKRTKRDIFMAGGPSHCSHPDGAELMAWGTQLFLCGLGRARQQRVVSPFTGEQLVACADPAVPASIHPCVGPSVRLRFSLRYLCFYSVVFHCQRVSLIISLSDLCASRLYKLIAVKTIIAKCIMSQTGGSPSSKQKTKNIYRNLSITELV